MDGVVPVRDEGRSELDSVPEFLQLTIHVLFLEDGPGLCLDEPDQENQVEQEAEKGDPEKDQADLLHVHAFSSSWSGGRSFASLSTDFLL